MNLKRETDLEKVRSIAQLALDDNARLVAELVRVKRALLIANGAAPEQLQQELALLDAKIATDEKRFEENVEKQTNESKTTSSAKTKKPRDHSGPRAEQKTLRIIEEVHDVDEADRKCVECGGDMSLWEGQDDVTEEVDVISREFVIKKRTRRKYRCTCGCLESADMPARLVRGGRYSTDFAVEVAAMKYVDQLPLERIVKIVGREGLVIDSQTLWDQVNALAAKLAPAHTRLRETILQAPVIGMDQSPWKVLGHKKTWQMWTLTTTTLAYFDICQTKGAVDGRRVLGDYAGTIIGDAATTHDALASTMSFRLAHCWAHVLRDAEKLAAADPMRAQQVIGFIRKLYDVDRDAGDDVDKRQTLRSERSRPIVKELYEWRLGQRALPSSPTAKLFGYLDRHRVGLERFLDDARVPLDNNQSERGYCWVAVGRRSFFGSRSKRGTEVAAEFYSLAETARRCGKEPRAYFAAAVAAALAGTTAPLPHELT